MDVCLLNQDGERLGHRDLPASPETFVQAIAPYREAMVVAGACLLTWYWRADLCAHAGRPCGLGHALSRKAIQGGKATNDRLDARQLAVLRRGGLLPQAAGSPAARRATRDLRQRRMPCMRPRAAWLTPIPPTKSQYH